MRGQEHPLPESVILACLASEPKVKGISRTVIERLAAVGGREKHIPDWEQLLQQLAELHVVHRVLTWSWPEGTTFALEPSGSGSKKNPEIVATLPHMRIGVEVKAPSIISHIKNRSNNPIQIASRFAPKAMLDSIADPTAGVTMPRDNPVKDFLVSAEAKFEPFRRTDPDFYGILVIVWDNFTYEPISALLQTDSGLFTESSFFKKLDGSNVTFPSVAGVIIISHLHQLLAACEDRPLIDGCQHPLDYGQDDQYPWKIYIQNPWGPEVPQAAIEALGAKPQTDDMGAEYRPQEYIMWLNTSR